MPNNAKIAFFPALLLDMLGLFILQISFMIVLVPCTKPAIKDTANTTTAILQYILEACLLLHGIKTLSFSFEKCPNHKFSED